MRQEGLVRRIGARVRQRRLELGLTQTELAGDRFTKRLISQVERGLTWPSLRALAEIADRLGRPLEWFVVEKPDTDG